MTQLVESARPRRKRNWALALAIATIALVAGAATLVFLRSRTKSSSAGWEAIEALARANRWAQLRPKLERWIASHPEHGESRILLADAEFRDNRRDAAVELLRAVRPEDPSWARAQMVLGKLAVMERRAADAERIFRGVADRDPLRD